MLRHLDLLNVFLALRFKQPGYPDCLSRLGYLVHSIGVTILLGDGTRLAPDVVAQAHNLTLLTEVKGGKELEGDQLARMNRVTPADLREFAYLPIHDVSVHVVHVLYVCNEESREALTAGIGVRRATVAGFDGKRFRLSGTPLPDAALARCLEEARVNEMASPLTIVPFDDKSPEEEVAAFVVPEIIAGLVAGAGTFGPADILASTHGVVHQLTQSTGSGSERPALLKRVKTTLERLATAELAEWIERVPKQPTYRFKQDLALDPARRTRDLQRLRAATARYLGSQQQPGTPVQLPLLFGAGEAEDDPDRKPDLE